MRRTVLLMIAALAGPLVAQAPADSSAPERRGILPVVGYSDVTGLQYGATVFRSFRAGGKRLTRPSTDAVYFARTAKGHAKSFVQIERWNSDNTRRRRIRAQYLSYPLPYFGVGPDTPEDAEEWYSSGVTTLQAFDQRALGPGNYALIGFRQVHASMREARPGGLVAGAPGGSTDSRVLHLQLGLVRDTRDDLGAPRQGTYAQLVASVPGPFRARFDHSRLSLDARRYSTLGAGHVLATQFQYETVAGRVPFDHLPMVGADTAVRGYPRGRFRDRHAATAQVELRTPHWRRLGLVAFAGFGVVAPRATELVSVPWHPSAGLGARLLLSARDRSVARLDLGFGRKSVGITVGLAEAF